jgi:hypothetical protein
MVANQIEYPVSSLQKHPSGLLSQRKLRGTYAGSIHSYATCVSPTGVFALVLRSTNSGYSCMKYAFLRRLRFAHGIFSLRYFVKIRKTVEALSGSRSQLHHLMFFLHPTLGLCAFGENDIDIGLGFGRRKRVGCPVRCIMKLPWIIGRFHQPEEV